MRTGIQNSHLATLATRFANQAIQHPARIAHRQYWSIRQYLSSQHLKAIRTITAIVQVCKSVIQEGMSSIYKLYPPQRLTKQPPLACERGLKSSQRDVVVISLSLSIQTRRTTTSSQAVVIVTNKNKNNNNNKRFQTILGRGLEYTLSRGFESTAA